MGNELGADDVPIYREFITEARGHLASAEAQLLIIEADPRNADAIDAIFRCFHTIKGVAGFLNLTQIGALAHSAENLLNAVRGGRRALDAVDADVVLLSIDQMQQFIEAIAVAVDRGGPLPGLSDVSGLLARLDQCAKAVPAQETQPREEPKVAPASAAAPAAGKGKAIPPAASSEGTINVSTERLDALINVVGELVIAHSMVNRDVAPIAAGNQRLGRNMTHLGKIARQLQELSMSMRMVPIHGVFQKMGRLTRDLSRKAGKLVELTTSGGETELDRSLVEAIGDPLLHMVRNAIDHAIEPSPDRVAAGKPPAGQVRLEAWQQAGYIAIRITDDGRGLDKVNILRKAVEQGLVRPEETLSEQEIFRLIFRAGLSTHDGVTEISGRGVGMDVVMRNVERLRGRIEIESVAGQGTTFTVRLPLTLAVIDGLVVSVGDHRYIVPLTNIDTSCKATAGQISTVQGRAEMCRVRDELVPLFRLHRLFGIAGAVEDPYAGLIVVVEDGARKCCLLVDAIVDQQQVVIKGLGDGLSAVPGVSGGAILGDGSVSLILDVPGIIDLARSRPRLVTTAAA